MQSEVEILSYSSTRLQIQEKMHNSWCLCNIVPLTIKWNNFSFFPSTCQTYHRNRNVEESRFLYWGSSDFADSLLVFLCRWCFDHDETQKVLWAFEKGKQK